MRIDFLTVAFNRKPFPLSKCKTLFSSPASYQFVSQSLNTSAEIRTSTAADNGLEKKKNFNFPLGLIEVTVGFVSPRWLPSVLVPVTHILSHLSAGPRGDERVPKHQEKSVCDAA